MLIDPDSVARVAKEGASSLGMSDALGSRLFMAPEVRGGANLDARRAAVRTVQAMLYSWGVVVLLLVLGMVPDLSWTPVGSVVPGNRGTGCWDILAGATFGTRCACSASITSFVCAAHIQQWLLLVAGLAKLWDKKLNPAEPMQCICTG
jgi:hypothetical protein